MKKLIPSNTDYCINCPLKIKIGLLEDVLCLPNGEEKDIQRPLYKCKYAKVTNEDCWELDEGVKVCGEKLLFVPSE